jgi:hypothetical protein
MKTRMQTDKWFYWTLIVLGLTAAASVAGTVVLGMIGRPVPEILIVLGFVAMTGLVRLLIFPLNSELFA